MSVNQVNGNAPTRVPITPLPPSEAKPEQSVETKTGQPQPIKADVRAKPLVEPGTSKGQQQSLDAIQVAQARVANRDNRALQNQLAEAIEYGQSRKEAVQEQFVFSDRLESESAHRDLQKHMVDRMGETFAEDKQSAEVWRVAFEADRNEMLASVAAFEQDFAQNESVRSEFDRDAASQRDFRANFDQDAAVQRDFLSNFRSDAATERDHLANFRGDAANERGFQSLFSRDVQELDKFWNQYFVTLENLYESHANYDSESFDNMRGLAKNFVEDGENLKYLQSLNSDQLSAYLGSVFGQAGNEVSGANVGAAQPSQPTAVPTQENVDRVSQPQIQPPNLKPAEETISSSQVTAEEPSTGHARQSVSQVAARIRPGSVNNVGNAIPSTPSNPNKISDSIKNMANDRIQAQQALAPNQQPSSTSSSAEIRELEDVRPQSADEVAQNGLAIPGLSDWVRSTKSKPAAKSEAEQRRKDPRQNPSEQQDAPSYTESDDSTEQDSDTGDARYA